MPLYSPAVSVPPGYEPWIGIADEQFLLQLSALKLSGTHELALSGTGLLALGGYGVDSPSSPIVGAPKGGSFTVPDGWAIDILWQLNLTGDTGRGSPQATLQGAADLILTDDFASRSTVILSGKG